MKKTGRFIRFLFFVSVFLLPPLPVEAEIPALIKYQGRLIDGTNLVNRTVSMVMNLYDASTGGNLLYADSNAVSVVDGIYNTHLGDNTIYGSLTNALANSQVYLELKIDGATLSPRERIVAVPYALRAGTVDDTTASLQDSSGFSITDTYTVGTGRTVRAGALVVLMSDGTIREYSRISSPEFVLSNWFYSSDVCVLTTQKVVIVNRGSYYPYYYPWKAIVADVVGANISFGQESIFSTDAVYSATAKTLATDKFVVAWTPRNSSGNWTAGKAVIGTVSGDTISYGSETIFSTNHYSSASIDVSVLDSNKLVAASIGDSSSITNYAVIGTVSGDTISWGSNVVTKPAVRNVTAWGSDRVVLHYADPSNSMLSRFLIGNITGDNISWGPETVFTNSGSYSSYSSYSASVSSNSFAYLAGKYVTIGYVTETNISWGSASKPPKSWFGSHTSISALDSSAIVVADGDVHWVGIGSINSSSNIVWADIDGYYGAGYELQSPKIGILDTNTFLIAFYKQTGGEATLALVKRDSLLPYGRKIGIARESKSAGQSCEVALWGVVNAYSNLTAGRMYYTDRNGNITNSNSYYDGGASLGGAVSPTAIFFQPVFSSE